MRISGSHCRRRAGAMVGAMLGISVAALSGCSQVNGLDASTPDAVYMAQTVAIDAVIGAGFGIHQPPVCTGSSVKSIICAQGKTSAGQPIAATVSSGSDPTIKVSVGDNVVFDGLMTEEAAKRGRVEK